MDLDVYGRALIGAMTIVRAGVIVLATLAVFVDVGSYAAWRTSLSMETFLDELRAHVG